MAEKDRFVMLLFPPPFRYNPLLMDENHYAKVRPTGNYPIASLDLYLSNSEEDAIASIDNLWHLMFLFIN